MLKHIDVVKEAAEVEAEALTLFRQELELVRFHAREGVSALAPYDEQLRLQLINYTPAGPRLLDLVDALARATKEVELARPIPRDARAAIDQVFASRDVLLAQLVSWGKAEMVDAAVVRRIQAGNGPVDAARDIVDIAEIVKTTPAVKAKLLCSLAELDAMVDLAEEVIESITPQGGRKGQSEKLLAATDLQSRIWVLVQRQYRVLWQHGALIFGHEVSEFVPPLGTRTRRGGKRDEAPVTPDSPSP